MKRIVSIVMMVLAVCGTMYLAGSFMSLSMNPLKWGEFTRYITSIVAAAVIIVGIIIMVVESAFD